MCLLLCRRSSAVRRISLSPLVPHSMSHSNNGTYYRWWYDRDYDDVERDNHYNNDHHHLYCHHILLSSSSYPTIIIFIPQETDFECDTFLSKRSIDYLSSNIQEDTVSSYVVEDNIEEDGIRYRWVRTYCTVAEYVDTVLHAFIYQSIYSSTHLSINLSIHPLIYLSINLSIHPLIYFISVFLSLGSLNIPVDCSAV